MKQRLFQEAREGEPEECCPSATAESLKLKLLTLEDLRSSIVLMGFKGCVSCRLEADGGLSAWHASGLP